MSTPIATPLADTLPLTDRQLGDHVVATLDAVLSCADVSTIGATHWWDRATSALKTAAGAGHSWPRVVSTLAGKLQVDVIQERHARTLAELGAQLDPAALGRWCYLAGRDTPYLVAMCRIVRDDRRATKPARAAAQTVAPLTLDSFATEII